MLKRAYIEEGVLFYCMSLLCPFDYTTVAGSGKVGPVNQVNHTSWVAVVTHTDRPSRSATAVYFHIHITSWVAVVTPIDRPKSVRNCCLIELVCGAVCVVILPFWQFVWCRGFCHRTESDLFLFLLHFVKGPTKPKTVRIKHTDIQ